ncbi:hypothetical protein BAE44_0017090 [Dichanthelium oligosanthes]|uniref:F-box/kelch-repeat protein n=1 Tax=Dichanthelium oligosanthes TaxID=888268 RepID=A0A1E5V9V4_9POAL|nr:hypothetical protein BAE44_0017090 [Dichanthelium oligosanthes]
MGLSRRFVNLIVDSQTMCGAKSLRCIDLTRQQFFRPSPPPPATRGGSESAVAQDSTTLTPAALAMEQLQLPDSTLSFQAEAENHRWNIDCFHLADRKVLCADQSGRAFLLDADMRHLVTTPSLHKPKRMPFSLFVPNTDVDAVHSSGGGSSGSLFVMERIPRPEAGSDMQTSGQFEAFIYRKPTTTSFAESWHCQLLPPPPYLRDYKYCKRRHKIAAYGVVGGGSQICLSVEDVGTYCLDTASHVWSEVGKWTLPFLGKVEYVPELKLWFGLSADAQHLAAADLSSLDSQPQLLGPWKELEPPKEWQEVQEAQLVNLGSGRFCIARFFETRMGRAFETRMGTDFDELFTEDYFVVLTGVEFTASVQDGKCGGSSSGSRNGEVELEMNTHKSLCHMSNGTAISAVF